MQARLAWCSSSDLQCHWAAERCLFIVCALCSCFASPSRLLTRPLSSFRQATWATAWASLRPLLVRRLLAVEERVRSDNIVPRSVITFSMLHLSLPLPLPFPPSPSLLTVGASIPLFYHPSWIDLPFCSADGLSKSMQRMSISHWGAEDSAVRP